MALRPAAALLCLAMVAAACAGGPAADRADSTQPTAQATSTIAVDDGGDGADGDSEDVDGDDSAADGADTGDAAAPATVEALWWTATTVADGSTFAAAELSGGNVVLWMWAPWCSVCNREAPDVARALQDLPQDVTVIGVAGRDDVGPMQEFVAEHGLQDMTHVVDADGAVWASYGISYQPAWVFIDARGNTAVAAGALGYDGLFAGIDEVFGT